MITHLPDWTRTIFRLGRPAKRPRSFSDLFSRFRKILESNNRILDLMTGMGDKLSGDYIFDSQYIHSTCREMGNLVYMLIQDLNYIAGNRYRALNDAFRRINSSIEDILEGKTGIEETDLYVLPHTSVNTDIEAVVGSKNANIAELKNILELKVPDGFAITTNAFRFFLEYNGIDLEIKKNIDQWQKGQLSSAVAASKISRLIKQGKIPPKMKKQINRAMQQLSASAGNKKFFVAVRSSALGEDGQFSFAGQYLSLLNEPRDNIFKSYKSVIASVYTETAMEYRKSTGFDEHETAMAVICMIMINPKVSGVLYTMDPMNPESKTLIINANWGLGAPVVAGEMRSDSFEVQRDSAHKIVGMNIVRKTQSLETLPEGGVALKKIDPSLQTKACIKGEEAVRLAQAGLIIERYFKQPQDIEFSIDHDGVIWFLQARPLNIKEKMAKMICDIREIAKTYPVIFSGKGLVAQSGVATGKVFMHKMHKSLDEFSQGDILVAEQTSPIFAKIARNAAGIITDIGSPTGHMATIAREFRVPTIVDTQVATSMLSDGQQITLDADANVVYDGNADALCYYEFTDEHFEQTAEYRLLKRVLKKISPLNFVDPEDKRFSPKYCRTFHDITRFVHEKAVEELINLNYYDLKHDNSKAVKLDIHIPLDLMLIDVGGGLDDNASDNNITQDNIVSEPLKAFLKGLTKEGMWCSEPMSVDFGSFMSSLTRTFSSHLANPKDIGRNLVIMSENYANISLRLGYHFNMVDAYMSDSHNDNYAYFRFFGGVTDVGRRSRRVSFISEVLAEHNFRVENKRDLIVARIKKVSKAKMEESMVVIGQLVAFTRQLDVKMINDDYVAKYIDDFWAMTKHSSG